MRVHSGEIFDNAENGQAMVEIAIVLPLFLFIILGGMQATLLYQAKSFAKYAAYRAVRIGVVTQMDQAKMITAATLALSPVIRGAKGCPIGVVNSVQKLKDFKTCSRQHNNYGGTGNLRVVDVRVCGPFREWVNGFHRHGNIVDFDDPRNILDLSTFGINDAKRFEGTRLRIQVRYNHKLIIPFANWIFYRIWRGQELLDLLRMGGQGDALDSNYSSIDELARQHEFFFPVYSNYAFRMQSGIPLDRLPSESSSRCKNYVDTENY